MGFVSQFWVMVPVSVKIKQIELCQRSNYHANEFEFSINGKYMRQKYFTQTFSPHTFVTSMNKCQRKRTQLYMAFNLLY